VSSPGAPRAPPRGAPPAPRRAPAPDGPCPTASLVSLSLRPTPQGWGGARRKVPRVGEGRARLPQIEGGAAGATRRSSALLGEREGAPAGAPAGRLVSRAKRLL